MRNQGIKNNKQTQRLYRVKEQEKLTNYKDYIVRDRWRQTNTKTRYRQGFWATNKHKDYIYPWIKYDTQTQGLYVVKDPE